ncbi:hypothetical protein [Streptomyces liangshanensis]|uniref:pPIWI-RE three-gene island domain-containing protein n=1 Tax=Streptomyces liangshanensis TaxID=2717324 RepID=A0A6G9H3K4_9ACTN|nr:hypothetical protein [Streptomyces liangshanensis]QIQ05118.1 hypothetical protein HA039_25115 [Streptomyces liangshanensis]
MTGTPGRRRTRRTDARLDVEGGVALFAELASVIYSLTELRNLRSFTLPYPAISQFAFDRTVLRCLQLGQQPPRSIAELLEWCRHRSADSPLFGVPSDLVTPDATLVHPVGLMPTRTCLEVASYEREDGPEREALALLDELATRCGSTDRYRACRSFLQRHPMVSGGARYETGWNRNVWTRVKTLYEPVPESFLAGGYLLRCPACGLPALLGDRRVPDQGPPFSGDDTWCEGETCRSPQPFEVIHEPEKTWILRRSLRTFLALPHRVEESALAELDRAGIECTLLTDDLAAYRLSGAGPGTRILQFRNRIQPALLAAGTGRCAESLAADLTVVAVPRRFAECGQYRAAFFAALPRHVVQQVRLTHPHDIARCVRAPLAGSSPQGPTTGKADGDDA